MPVALLGKVHAAPDIPRGRIYGLGGQVQKKVWGMPHNVHHHTPWRTVPSWPCTGGAPNPHAAPCLQGPSTAYGHAHRPALARSHFASIGRTPFCPVPAGLQGQHLQGDSGQEGAPELLQRTHSSCPSSIGGQWVAGRMRACVWCPFVRRWQQGLPNKGRRSTRL